MYVLQKAFDSVEYPVLLEKSPDRELCNLLLPVLVCMHAGRMGPVSTAEDQPEPTLSSTGTLYSGALQATIQIPIYGHPTAYIFRHGLGPELNSTHF
jgi:hypothetical protein